jgi:hypothetical protein
MDNYVAYINPMVERLHKLKELGFASYRETLAKDGRDVLHCWERILPWKKDVVQLSHLKSDPNSCEYGFQIYLTVEGRDRIFTVAPPSAFKHRQTEFKFPQLFKKIRASSTVEEIAGDILGSIDWFKRYGDKKVCLALIREANPENNIPIGPAAPIYPAVEKLLTD